MSTIITNEIQTHDGRVLDPKNISTASNTLKQLTQSTNPQTVGWFFNDTTTSGGTFIWSATESKTNHNGGTIIAPEAITAWNGSKSDIATLLNWTGTGTGCYIRVSPVQGISAFGGNNTNAADCITAMYKATDGRTTGGYYINGTGF